jgi:hypothetical protein
MQSTLNYKSVKPPGAGFTSLEAATLRRGQSAYMSAGLPPEKYGKKHAKIAL